MFPTFATSPLEETASITKRQAAGALGLNMASLTKMVRAGMLPLVDDARGRVDAKTVDRLTGRPRLVTTHGELTVLRTDAGEPSKSRYPDDNREWLGFDVGFTDEVLAAASLRWWRCNPERVVDNGLFAVTVATFPVALFMLGADAHAGTIQLDNEGFERHHFEGLLLARVGPGMVTRFSPDLPDWLAVPAEQVMSSTIEVSAGGPVGYLTIGGSN
ncbi:hypothetical protein [Agromyces sp. Soil535]|uniref:hypothetical protein n=1 Tax=Agromyces sp. Soil535 TaxID=1736390 RepID=UPI0006FC80F3|nr:hypothetical protein [Agromyces sp. Soil535]KRE28265.1 hypothetical protein ASG80_21545 [Agromyces sp. Soil535]